MLLSSWNFPSVGNHWHTSECPDLLSVSDNFRFTPSAMITDYLLSWEEAGEHVLCVEIDCIADAQG